METGQIARGSFLGEVLYSYCKENLTIKNVVEIGTWRGLGSTLCIVQGMEDSEKEDISFISIESNLNMYQTAVSLWEDKSPSWLNLVHGRVVDILDMDKINLGYQHPDEASWFEQDKKALESCPDVADSLPDIIDLLLLDGGEFTTEAEFWRLKDRSRYIFLDDTTARKCKNIRAHVLNNLNKYEVLFDKPEERNGVMVILNKGVVS
jgi:hypothetical protein